MLGSSDCLLDRDSIDDLIPQYLRENGIPNPPDVKWSIPIVGPVQKLQRKNRWSESFYEQVMSSVLEDILLGENLDTDREAWSQGTLADQVMKWLDQGKTAKDIRYIVGSFVNQKAIQKCKRLMKSPGQGPVKGIRYDGSGQDAAGSPETPNNIIEGRYPVSGRTRGLLNRWFSNCWRRDSENREIINKVTEKIKEKSSLLYILWRGYLSEGGAPLSEVRKAKIEFQGEEKTVQEALDEQGVSSVYYVRNKLREWLKKNWPESSVNF